MSTAYEIVTEFIIKQLESGVAPWRKPWGTGDARKPSQQEGISGNQHFPSRLAGLRLPLLGYLSSSPRTGRNSKERPTRVQSCVLEDPRIPKREAEVRGNGTSQVNSAALLHRVQSGTVRGN